MKLCSVLNLSLFLVTAFFSAGRHELGRCSTSSVVKSNKQSGYVHEHCLVIQRPKFPKSIDFLNKEHYEVHVIQTMLLDIMYVIKYWSIYHQL